MRLALAFVVAAAVAAIVAPAASAQTTAPNPHPVTRDGPTGRFMLDGPWLVRVDRRDRGAGQDWGRRRATAGWTPVTIPNAWNATDRSESGFIGAPAWYRKDFRLPSRARGLDWRLRFDSGNYRATVWLHGRLAGRPPSCRPAARVPQRPTGGPPRQRLHAVHAAADGRESGRRQPPRRARRQPAP